MSALMRSDESGTHCVSECGHGIDVALGDVADLPVEQTGPESDFVYVDISSVDRESKKILNPKALSLAEAPSRAKQVLQAGDVLISMTRPNLNAVALVPDSLDGAIASTGFHVLRSSWMKPEFLFNLVQTGEFVDAMCDVVQGALYPAVRPKDIASFKFLLQSSMQQTRIVAKLEELLSDLDAGVAELKAAQKKLAQYHQSLLNAAVEGALTAEWRALHPPAETGYKLLERILAERRARWEAKQLVRFKEQDKAPPKDWQKKYREPVRPDIANLPALPEGWVWASAEQLCEFITKGTTPPKDVDDGSQSDIPFLRVTNLTNRGVLDMCDEVFVSEATHREFLARSVVYPGDVLMNIVGPPLGQVSLVPDSRPEWNINQAIAIYRAVDGVIPSFICSYLLSPVAKKWLKARAKTTAGQTNLTLELCRCLPVPLPPTGEQRELERLLDAAATAAADQEGEIRMALKQSAAQRQNILRTAFSGQLVQQDSNDEPASVLLERIRAGRAVIPAKTRKAKSVISRSTAC